MSLIRYADMEYDKEYVGSDGYIYVKPKELVAKNLLLSNKTYLNDKDMSGLMECEILTGDEVNNMYFIPLKQKPIFEDARPKKL